MIGLIIQLIISWLLLKYVEQQNLNVLGLLPNKIRMLDLGRGVLWPVGFYCIFNYVVSVVVHNPYRINGNFTGHDLITSIGHVARSVAYEELIFRGAILYILIKRLGINKAIIISSIAFGIYHWFSWNAFGNPIQMLIIFLMTGAAGYLFAVAYAKTRSMYLPFGLHFGSNFCSMILFSKDHSIGLQLLERTYTIDPVVPPAIIGLPILVLHFVGYLLLTFWWLYKMRFRAENSRL